MRFDLNSYSVVMFAILNEEKGLKISQIKIERDDLDVDSIYFV